MGIWVGRDRCLGAQGDGFGIFLEGEEERGVRVWLGRGRGGWMKMRMRMRMRKYRSYDDGIGIGVVMRDERCYMRVYGLYEVWNNRGRTVILLRWERSQNNG